MNNSGPSIEPWGMPHDTYCSVDKTSKWRIRDLPSAGKLFEMRVTLNSKPSMEFSCYLSCSETFWGKILRVFFLCFSGSFFCGMPYFPCYCTAEWSATCFFFFIFFFILKTCRRKEMAPLFHFTCKHSAP